MNYRCMCAMIRIHQTHIPLGVSIAWSTNLSITRKTNKNAACRDIGMVQYSLSESDLRHFDKKTGSGREIWRLDYTIEVQMGADVGILCVRCLANGNEIGKANIEYA